MRDLRWFRGKITSQTAFAIRVKFLSSGVTEEYKLRSANSRMWLVQHDGFKLQKLEAENDDTITVLSQRTEVPAAVLMKLNLQRYENLTVNAKLKKGTELLVPTKVQTQSPERKAGKEELKPQALTSTAKLVSTKSRAQVPSEAANGVCCSLLLFMYNS